MAAILALFIGRAVAQNFVPYLGNPWLMNEGAMAVPSLQGMGFARFSISIPSAEVWADNTAIPYGPLRDVLLFNKYTGELVESVANSTDDRFFLGAGGQAQFLSLGMNISNKEGRTLFSIGVEHRERTLISMDIDPELVTVLYEGNKQFAGENLVLDPLTVRSMSYRELGANLALDIPLGGTNEHRTRLRPGLGIYGLIGLQGLYMNDASLEMFTHSDGRAIDLVSNYDLNMALPTDDSQLFSGVGNGIAVDVSASILFDDHAQLFVGLDDLGSIRFTKGPKNYRAQGDYTYRGVQYTFIDQELGSSVTLDSLVQLGKPTITEQAWRMDLPTQFIVGGTYGSGRMDGETLPVFRHSWGLCIQHDVTRPSFNYSRTNVMATYTHTLKKIASFGVTAASNSDRIPRVGIKMTFRAGPVRLGLGSTDLLPLFLNNSAYSGQGQAVLQFAW
jgi:hypothetical protein